MTSCWGVGGGNREGFGVPQPVMGSLGFRVSIGVG